MKRRAGRVCCNAGILLLLLLAAVSGVTLVRRLAAERKHAVEMESLADVVNAAESAACSPSRAELPMSGPGKGDRENRLEGYALLKEENADLAGWICIPGTNINYPVMQSPGRPDYYLKHGFDKSPDNHGLPYLADGCELSEDCSNRIIYGHHMRDGTMFASLQKYEDEEYFMEHPVIQFDVPDEASDYKVVGVLKACAFQGKDSMFELAAAKGQEGYEAYIDAVKSRSFYDTGVTASYGEPLITLITCEYSQKEGRLLIVAVKQECGR